MPGVTVTGRSPAVQLPEVTSVTDAKGEYEIRDLRPGGYTLRFELAGFQTLNNEGLRLKAAGVTKLSAGVCRIARPQT